MTPITMPDGRPWATGYQISQTSNRVLHNGKEVSTREMVKRCGWTISQVRKRMNFYDLTLDEAMNIPAPPRGGRISASALQSWLADVYRPWRRSQEPVPPQAAPSPPNGQDPAPGPSLGHPEAISDRGLTLRVETTSPDTVLKAFEAFADRLDGIEAKLDHLTSLWEPK